MPRPAISASRCATMAWPRGGWWYGHRHLWSGLRRVSRKHVSVKRRLSKNNSFTCKRSVLRPSQAQQALSALAHPWRYHQVQAYELIDHKRYAKQGRPMADTPIKAIEWQMQAQVRPDPERLEEAKQHKACFVLGTNIEAEQLSDAEVITGSKGQAQAEGGFRFLKDPLFFVSSLFVKKPCRIQGLLMVMTLALLVYAVAPRRLRRELSRQNETIPHQLHQPTNRPTLRWVFQV